MVNAFWLDRDLQTAVEWLVDKHVTSSVFECSMVLTTAAQLNGVEGEDLYFTHRNHPLTQWAAESYDNWRRLRAYTEAAHGEWRYRWDHAPEDRHGCWATVETLDPETVRELAWPTEAATDPPQVTGEWTAPDYVDAYRYYYANEKRHLFQWSKDREEPPWIAEYTVAAEGTESDPSGDARGE
ncbi:hypothetical protein [Halopelagius longus]|uniref:Uncharacterized protein n=1 Tax=Halopelagius longus TaxID=1236180 RepID=A0A1H0Y656_9EURY|nr:hypothetical protein [Halopelagius longus]RDI72300.1 hypothetical protein DWB78_11585 [Halopelagius longus]SDQ10654.1 hypothetical protein SAMN05216278_0429 [Halopelagius longus]